jgi:hypothetical protein
MTRHIRHFVWFKTMTVGELKTLKIIPVLLFPFSPGKRLFTPDVSLRLSDRPYGNWALSPQERG